MTKHLILAAPLWFGIASAGCSVLFAPSGYPQGRDAGTEPTVDGPISVTTDAAFPDAFMPDAGPLIRTPWPRCDGMDPVSEAGDAYGVPIMLGDAHSVWVGAPSRVSAFGLLSNDFALPGINVRAVALTADRDSSAASNDLLYAATLTPADEGTLLHVFRVRVDLAAATASDTLLSLSFPGEPADVAISEKAGALEVLVVTSRAPHIVRFSTAFDITVGPDIVNVGTPTLAAYANDVPVVASSLGIFRVDNGVSEPLYVYDRIALLVGSAGNRVYTRRDTTAVGVDVNNNIAMFSARTVVGTGMRDYPLVESSGTYGLRTQTFAGTLASAHAAPDHRENDFIVVGASQSDSSEIRVMTVFPDDTLGPSFVLGTRETSDIDLEMAVTSNAYGVGVFALSLSSGGARLNGFRICAAAP